MGMICDQKGVTSLLCAIICQAYEDYMAAEMDMIAIEDPFQKDKPWITKRYQKVYDRIYSTAGYNRSMTYSADRMTEKITYYYRKVESEYKDIMGFFESGLGSVSGSDNVLGAAILERAEKQVEKWSNGELTDLEVRVHRSDAERNREIHREGALEALMKYYR